MSVELNEAQERLAVETMRAYLSAASDDGRMVVEFEADLDSKRISIIQTELKPLLSQYLAGKIAVADFKTKIDGINKRNRLWGFNGTKGQMFFNLLLNVAESRGDDDRCDKYLKAAIDCPAENVGASNQITQFCNYVADLCDWHIQSGGAKHAKPNQSSVPFFVSYFWQIQGRDVWPIYYTNSVNVLTDLNLWQPTGQFATDYLDYKKLHEELVRIFTVEAGRTFTLYDVEHVFWFQGGKAFVIDNAVKKDRNASEIHDNDTRVNDSSALPVVAKALPDSYVPPIVAVLPAIALNDVQLREAAKESGTSLERALEKSIDAAFSILGYETQLLGQGKGRVPDGLASSMDDSYAILWDAKIRGDGYRLGTDDRVIKDYIVTQSRELKRKRGLRNIYYFVISSNFDDDYDDAIRSLKMETDINEVCLVEAEALVAMVDAKMRHPQDVSLGPDGLQRLFASSGIVSAEIVREILL